jgi:cysteine-rich repeat protein
MRHLLALALLLAPAIAQGQIAVQWHRGLGTDFEEHVHEGVQTSDGGYVAIGHAAEGSGNQLDMLVIKTDGSGNQEWMTRIGTAGQMDIGIAIAETSSGFVAGGGLYAGGRQRRALVGLDHDGNVLWQETYSGGGSGAVRGVDVLGDGKILATGYYDSDEPGFVFLAEATGFLMQTDASGNLQWDRVLDVMQGTKVRIEDSGDISVLGAQWVFAGGVDALNAKLIRTDASGNETWSATYGGPNHIDPFDFDPTADGGFVIGGHTTGYGTTNWDCILFKVDAAGNESWHRIFGQPRGYDARYIHDECYGVRERPGGGFALVGGTGDEYSYSQSGHPSGPSDEWKAYLILTDADGNLIEEAVFGDGAGQGNNAAEYLSLTDDGCFLLFNDTDSAGTAIPNNFGFMKICSGGCGNGSPDPGEQCDDGNSTNCDGCDNDGTLSTTCGNGTVCGAEQCDDGNTAAGDCCSATCSFETTGAACDDSSLCTSADACDGAGTCQGNSEPDPTCLAAGSSKVVIRGFPGDERSSFTWLWKKGPELQFSDLGDPLGSGTDYALCLYDEVQGSDRLVATLDLPGGGECARRSCWKTRIGKTLNYADKDRTPDGIQQMLVKVGPAGRSKIKLRGRGEDLALPSLPIAPSPWLRVQLKNSTGACWASEFDTSEASDDIGRFQGRY